MEPKRFGRYLLIGQLGQGGMGTVYRAHDELLGRVVALKTLRVREGEGAPSAERRQRFEREARAAAALNHPHIATLYDFGEAELDGSPTLFLAMEHVEGDDLSTRLREEQLEPDYALELAEQICSALQAAHAAGIVHRDLKPSNVRVTLDGRVKVLDFGVAKVLEDSPTSPIAGSMKPSTRSGVVLGTLGYIAPEQLRGHRLDGRADLFSLGAMLYEMLAGERAFPNDSVADYLLAVERGEAPRLPDSVEHRVPGARRTVARLLARLPDERTPNAVEARRELHGLRDSLRSGQSRAPAARMRRAAAWAAGAALVLAVAGAWWVTTRRAERTPGAAEPLRLAVLPFLNDTGDPDQEAVALGLGFFLSSRLRGLPGVEVLGSSVVAGYPTTTEGERRLIAEQAVDRVVRGNLQGSEGRLALLLEVQHARDGRPLRVETFEASREDPLLLQELAFETVTQVLDRQASDAPETTDSNQAYRRYVVAQQFLESEARLEDLDTAIHHLEQALAADDRFAFAHQSLADALLRRHELDHDAATLARALAAAESAVAFDPELPQAMRTLASALRTTGRVDEAAEWLQKAQRVDGHALTATTESEGQEVELPGEREEQEEQARTLLELGRTHAAAGHADEARDHMRRATELAPDWWLGWHALGVHEMRLGRYDAARQALEKAQELAPERTEPVENLTLLHLIRGDARTALAVYEAYGGPLADAVLASNIGATYFEAGDIDRAEQYFVLATRLQPGNETLRINLGDALHRRGNEQGALHQYQVARSLLAERLEVFPADANLLTLSALVAAKLDRCADMLATAARLERGKPLDGERLTHLAKGYALCGRQEEALRTVGRALEAGAPAPILASADELASLRDDPRFAALVASND